ncbi:anti-sigma factor domain-containing protein [Staphylospora marina]|uniref:anti-sigma factor domain-containing protein n=1 Tax=Staphylospora marina TaxID=2490858 RepID=UPI0013DDDCDD|nr:anti-sigma factor domain-containing protein [Staphylospora marina]
MKRGLILEVQKKHWIVLTPDGDFVKVRRTNLQAEAGEEVFFHEERKRFAGRSWLASLSAAAAAVLGIFFVYPLFDASPAEAETYIYLDMNPSLAIGIDGKRHVVDVKPLNKSANDLIESAKWQGEDAGEFVADMIDAARDKGMVQQRDRIVLSGFSDPKAEKTLKEIKEEVSHDLKKKQAEQVELKVLTIPEKVRKNVEQTGLSPAKYAALLVANREGNDLTPDKLEEASINELAESIQPVSKLLEQPPTETEWDEMIQTMPEPKPVTTEGSDPGVTGGGRSGTEPATTPASGESSGTSGPPTNEQPHPPAGVPNGDPGPKPAVEQPGTQSGEPQPNAPATESSGSSSPAEK